MSWAWHKLVVRVCLWKLKTSPCSVYEWYLFYIYYLITPCVFHYYFCKNFFLLNLDSLDTRSMIDLFIHLSYLNCFCSYSLACIHSVWLAQACTYTLSQYTCGHFIVFISTKNNYTYVIVYKGINWNNEKVFY